LERQFLTFRVVRNSQGRSKLHSLFRLEFLLVNNGKNTAQIRKLLRSAGSDLDVRVNTADEIQALLHAIQGALFDRYLRFFREVTFDVQPTRVDLAFKAELFALVDRGVIRRSIATKLYEAYINQGGRLFSPANFKSDSVRDKLVENDLIEKHPEFTGIWPPSKRIRELGPVVKPAIQNAVGALLDINIADADSQSGKRGVA